MLKVEEVPRIDLVDGDVPERGHIEIAHVLVLSFRRPAPIHVGQVIVGPAWPGFEWTRSPHTGEGPSIELGRRGHHDRLGRRDRHDRLTLKKLQELRQLILGSLDQLARFRMMLLCLSPGFCRIAAVEPPGQRAKLLLNLVQLPKRDRQQAIGAERHTFFEAQLLLKGIATQSERSSRTRSQVCLEIPDVSANGLGRLRRGVG